MTYLVKTMSKKNHNLTSIQGNLSSVQGELESFHLQDASLTQKFPECISSTLEAGLLLIYFHFLLVVSREQIQADQILKDGEIVSQQK